MIYLFVLLDKPDSLPLREALRPAHREYIAAIADKIAFAGPLVAEDGDTRTGSLLAIDFPDKAAASAWLQEEPFTQGGLYQSVEIHGFLNFWPQKTGFPARQ